MTALTPSSKPFIDLPPAIAIYIDGANAADSDAVASSFTADAVVHDEGRDWKGVAAIVAWKEETTRKYKPQTTVTGVEKTGGDFIVTASVSGDFKGSPVVLKYAFRLEGAKIASLRIAA